jgi:hypothetical protein
MYMKMELCVELVFFYKNCITGVFVSLKEIFDVFSVIFTFITYICEGEDFRLEFLLYFLATRVIIVDPEA